MSGLFKRIIIVLLALSVLAIAGIALTAHFAMDRGEALRGTGSLLDFQVIQYRRKGNAVATQEQLERIAKVTKREFIRRGINQHTLEKICKRVPVRASKLGECLRVLEEYEVTLSRSEPTFARIISNN